MKIVRCIKGSIFDIELVYMSTSPYCKEAESGIRYDDPKVGIQWPLDRTVISEKDLSYSFLPDNVGC